MGPGGLTIVRPAPLLDLADMLARDDIPLGLRKFGLGPLKLAQLQRQLGQSWGYEIGGRILVCCGLIPVPAQDCLEAWFACRPEAAPHMLAVARAAQLTLLAGADDALVVARVAVGWRPGERLARAVGLTPGAAAGGEREWWWRKT